MNEPPKPGRVLVVNSVVVIALCAFFVSFTLSAFLIPSKVALVAWIFLFLAPAAYWQYRGIFCRDSRAALLAGALLFFGILVFVASASVMAIALAQAPIAFYWVSLGITGASAAYLPFVVWLDFRWSEALSSESPGQPSRPQFSIRDLLTITAWLAVVGGLTRWMTLSGM